MSIHVDMHIHTRFGTELHVHSDVQQLKDPAVEGQKSAFIKLRMRNDEVTLFFDDVDTIEQLAFHAQTLAMAAREQWGQKEENK